MRESLRHLREWLLGVTALLATIWLLYVGKDYPCLQGAGLALADFEAFILCVFIALPCLVWATIRLRRRSTQAELPSWDKKWIDRLALVVVIGSVLYIVVSVPVIFSVTPHPLQFICRQ
jgi:amino acid transporter